MGLNGFCVKEEVFLYNEEVKERPRTRTIMENCKGKKIGKINI